MEKTPLKHPIFPKDLLTCFKFSSIYLINIGYFRMKTLWPFPIKEIEELSQKVDKIVVAEMNTGKMYHKVNEYADCEVALADKIGGELPSSDEILKEV